MIDDIEEICNGLSSINGGIEMIFSTILMWFRDQTLCLMGSNIDSLFFKDDMPEDPLELSLENVHYCLDRAKDGINRNIKYSICLHNFFIELYNRV